ncbi:head-tail connector protein [Pararhodobacter aggregans]|uniref:Phage gp6-like head-tail connector protein n=1 Tax=Pararhodobacter aggregans TaxID=404875 RepID=A0A2T7UWZ9_9RHOB|nr:hypothetical protein [Pararhodobacter aggregans]PTX04745.1 putative phiE125 gp8 family phage protein [Pararhodobacter aggregans]PVE49078.1 hypothetical protein DDE23_01330 [Pararhodobacter aggregans]
MDLIETSIVADGVLPVAAFRAHLRLGTGFADETTGDALLIQYLRAAIAAIEARTGKVLIARDFRLILPRWRWPDVQALPVAPVSVVTAVRLVDAGGGAETADPGGWRLAVDTHRPVLLATGAVLPGVPANGRVEVDFTAGFGAGWDAVPDDLRQAVLLLAARFYDSRIAGGTGVEPIPGPVAALLARWMALRVTAGGHR